MFQKFENSTLYDFKKLKSRFDSKFFTKIDLESVKIDSLRGTCTPLALSRLNKIAKIKNYKTFYKIGSSGICLKVKKIYKQDRFSVEFFAMAQYYKLSNFAKRQHAEILRYLLTKKSFLFTEIDICLDSTQQVELIETSHTRTYKGTQYREYGESKMCVYRKDLKQDTYQAPPSNTIRYELTAPLTIQKGKTNHKPNATRTLKTAKYKQKEKPPKPLTAQDTQTYCPLNKKYNTKTKNKIKRKYNIKPKNKIKNTKDFIRSLNTS